jgi:hypothetical protein
MSKSTCGPQTEIMANNAVRVMRCTCGVLHVTVIASGVTLQLKPDAFRTIAAGVQAAVEKLDKAPEITSTGSTSIN